jgi:hypothetical protein
VQVDYELGPYDAKTNAPTEWFAYSHSSHYDDMAAGIKGVFHKYINRALTHAQASEKYVARVLKKSVKISDEPVKDSDYSFAVSSSQGGGMSIKYKPYIDPNTGEPMEKDGIPVMQLLDPKDRDYIQNLDQQFQMTYGRKRGAADKNLQGSFVGTLQLMNKSFTTEQNEAVARAFLEILFGQGAQMITKDDPVRDRDVKFAAIDAMMLGGDGIKPLNLPNGKGLRQEAVNMATEYADSFNAKKKPLAEAEVKAQLRKGMPHLRDLKPIDFLDLVDELSSEGGRFKLQNIPLNVKIDGFGGRFGKNAEGKPFMATSRTDPRYQAGFVDYHKQKGTTDPEILGRAANFDKLFDEMMTAVKLVDSKLGPDFLVDKQVTCEVLFLPFATKTDDDKLKFVGIEYDQLPKGVDLVLVPFRVVEASTGEEVPNGDQVVQELAELGQSGNVMFMSNRLTQKEGLDVTEIINPLDNLDELKRIVSDTAGKRDRASLELRRQVEAKLKPVQIALEKAIDEDPNIIGKDNLGQDYEGIVINSRLGPIKVTSQRQKDIIAQKNAAKASARTERPRENNNKTAVVAIGSFVGHRGHEELFNYTVNKAKEVSGDPYLFIGNAEGKDDPIPPAVKIQTWHKLYPEYANNISTVQQGGSIMQKIKHELINPLPGKPPRYDNIIIMVGEDRANLPMAGALMKSVNKFQGYEHVKVSLEVTPRGTGMSFTKLRNILKDPNSTPEQQYAVWAQGFDEAKLGKDWILNLMDITKKGMGVDQQPAAVPQPVAEVRLFNALVRPQRLDELDVSKTLNFATKAHSKQQYGDKPYITHPRAVAATGKKFFGAAFTPDAIKVALLHDVVEDTPYKLKQLAKMGYSSEVVQAVQLLTKNKMLSYAENIQAIIASGNKLAMMVKYADNYKNFTSDKSSWDPARAAHSQKKYLASLDMLGDALGVKKHLVPDQASTKMPTQQEVPTTEGDAEYDDEAGMAQSNLHTMARAVNGLLKTIKDNDNLPEWGQEKIAKAEMMLVSVWDYLLSQKEQGMDPKVNESRALAGLKQIVAELSSEKLGQYKKAAGAQASAADKAGDTKKADKRFSGIVKATKKQFANDEKGVAEGHGAMDPATMDKISHSVKAWNNADRNVEQLITQGHTIKFYPDKIEIFKGGDLLYSKDGNFSNVSNGMVVRAKNLVSNLIYKSKQGVAEGAPIVVAQAPIYIRNPKKAPQPYRNQGDIVPPTKPPSTEKRGVKGRPGQRPMPDYGVEEEKKKGADGKACWKGYKYAGTENGKDKCVPIGEHWENKMSPLVDKILGKYIR